MRALGENLTEKEIQDMIAEADEDRDGKVSYRGNLLSIYFRY